MIKNTKRGRDEQTLLLPLGVCKSVNKGSFQEEEEEEERTIGQYILSANLGLFLMWSKAEIVTPPGDNW